MAALCRRLRDACGKPLVINCVEGGRTTLLPRARLRELGYGLAIYPVTALLAAVEAMRRTYAAMLPEGDGVTLPVPIATFKSMTELMGYDDVAAFESRYKET